MSKLSNYQKKYPDTIMVDMKTRQSMSYKDVQDCVASVYQKGILLEGSVKTKRAILYISKDAADQGVQPGDIIFG